jgi:HlyD family secretion protein
MKLPFRVSWIFLTAGGLFLASNIAKQLFGTPGSEVRAEDRITAEREIPVPGVDERTAAPDGAWVGGNGVVEPADRETRVAGQVGGRVAKVAVQEGQKVEPGAVLVELETATEAANLASAAASVEQAQAALDRVLSGSRAEDIRAARADAAAAKARAEASGSTATRYDGLAKTEAVSADELERAKRQAEADQATRDAADARLAGLVAGSRREEIVEARARLKVAEAQRQIFQAAFDARTIRAPLAAEVLQVKVRAGEFWAPGGEPVVVLGDTNKLRARIDVEERDIGKLRPGVAAKVRASAFPGVDFPGKVVEIGRRMGRKNVRTDDPVERNDTKVLEVVLELEPTDKLVVGQRVMGYLDAGR